MRAPRRRSEPAHPAAFEVLDDEDSRFRPFVIGFVWQPASVVDLDGRMDYGERDGDVAREWRSPPRRSVHCASSYRICYDRGSL